MTTYGAITTSTYKAREAAHAAGGPQVVFTTFAVGDGNGIVPALSNAGVGLVHEVYRAAVNAVRVNPNNANQIDIQCVIPNSAGTFRIREIMILDADGAQVVAAICDIQKFTDVDGVATDFNFIVSVAIGDGTAVVISTGDASFVTESWVSDAFADVLSGLVIDDANLARVVWHLLLRIRTLEDNQARMLREIAWLRKIADLTIRAHPTDYPGY